jgi:hypothetical protein
VWEDAHVHVYQRVRENGLSHAAHVAGEAVGGQSEVHRTNAHVHMRMHKHGCDWEHSCQCQ